MKDCKVGIELAATGPMPQLVHIPKTLSTVTTYLNVIQDSLSGTHARHG